jgi:hypothetical protein
MAMDYAPDQAKQAARERFRGVWAASTVPFGADGGLDLPALRRDMARLTGDLAVNGVFCAGVMSEFWALTGTERRQVVEAVIREAAGKCQVIAHTGHHSADETIELTRHAQQAGADFVVVSHSKLPLWWSGSQPVRASIQSCQKMVTTPAGPPGALWQFPAGPGPSMASSRPRSS